MNGDQGRSPLQIPIFLRIRIYLEKIIRSKKMGSSFTGPLLNRERVEGSRSWHSGLPIQHDPDYVAWMDDFIEVVDETNVYVVVKDTSASVATAADVLNGEVVLSSEATTDDDGSTLQTQSEAWGLNSGKQLWFEARVKLSDADQMDAFVGLCKNVSTNPEAVLTDPDRLGFQVNDGNASILAKSEKNGTETSTDTGEDAADATYVKLGMHYDGNSVHYYVDRQKVASHSTNLPDDEQLAVTLFELSGNATGTKTLTADYVMVVSER